MSSVKEKEGLQENEHKLSWSCIVLWIGAAIVNFKAVFTNFDMDTAYAVATSYRHIRGDEMFLQMWEPHQTSAFLTDFFLYLFYVITGSFDGCVVFLQLCGLIVWTLATVVIVRLFSKNTTQPVANMIGIVFFIGHPKNTVMLEYSNMVILFSGLLFATLVTYFFEQNKKWLLVLSGILLCLTVLSYPSTVICAVAVIVCLVLFSNSRFKDILITTIVCGVGGIAYFTCFSIKVGISSWPQIIEHIVGGDSSHGQETFTLWFYLRETVWGMMWLALILMIGAFIFILCKKIMKMSVERSAGIAKLISSATLVISDIVLLVKMDGNPGQGANAWRFVPSVIYIVLSVSGVLRIKKITGKNRLILTCGALISVTSIAAVAVLTNLQLITVMNYCIVGTMASLPVLSESVFWAGKIDLKGKWGLNILAVLCFVLIFHSGLLINDYAEANTLVTGVENVVRKGPAKGILCGYMGYYLTNASIEAFSDNVMPGEAVLVVQERIVNSLAYMYSDSNISHYSMISTTTYGPRLLEYWQKYPDKVPDVIAVDCWFDNLRVVADSWIMRYVDSEYELVNTSDYWWFYRRKIS